LGSSGCPFQIYREKNCVSLINTGLWRFPPVVVGLFVTIFLWRNGPLGFFGILYTPIAMIIAQTVIATPHCNGYHLGSHSTTSPEIEAQILALGPLAFRWSGYLIKGGKTPSFSCGDGRVWRSYLRGGCLYHGRWQHQRLFRVLTTATVMETSRGNFDIAIALGIILLLLAYFINLILTQYNRGQGRDRSIEYSA